MKKEIEKVINAALQELGLEKVRFVVEHPDLKMGDYSTNVGIKTGKAKEIYSALRQAQGDLDFIEKIEIAGPGFINFHLSKEFFKNSLEEIIEKGETFGRGDHAKGFKVMVEHTDPNYFKKLHIGHYMPMTIGSTLANIFRWNGAEVREACYYSDVGLQAAKSVWAMKQGVIDDPYVYGTKAYDEDENAKKEITEINKKIYEHSDAEIEDLYKVGSKESVEGFEAIYKRFGIDFDLYFYESEAAKIGGELVKRNIGTIFEESDGAVVFKAEKYDPKLHTRVFINSEGIPTYEAKDLGLAGMKLEKFPYDLSVIVTANEQKEYFKVLLEALRLIAPELHRKTKHLSHGTLRLTTGKMSSRTGNVILADDLIEEVKERVKNDEQVAIAAIKYMILRQAIGNDIIFDFEKSVSTEGDSGVYLQYAHARANSILEKAVGQGRTLSDVQHSVLHRETHEVERLLYRFPEIIERAGAEYAPNYITTYLTELAASFNNFYAHEPVLEDSPESQYRLAIVEAFKIVMKNGLTILGIPAPERM